jgi:osmotically-inducible protein OsmY
MTVAERLVVRYEARRVSAAWHALIAALAAAATALAWAQPRSASDAVDEALAPTDGQLALAVEGRLESELAISNLAVSVRDGIATIVGAATSAEERLRAARIARGVAGVRRVDNQLDVDQTVADDPPSAFSDVASLEAAVAARLRGDPVLGDREIRVNADRRRNVVTLTGRVSSPMEKSRAGRLAAEAAAAIRVRNRLQVRPAGESVSEP